MAVDDEQIHSDNLREAVWVDIGVPREETPDDEGLVVAGFLVLSTGLMISVLGWVLLPFLLKAVRCARRGENYSYCMRVAQVGTGVALLLAGLLGVKSWVEWQSVWLIWLIVVVVAWGITAGLALLGLCRASTHALFMSHDFPGACPYCLFDLREMSGVRCTECGRIMPRATLAMHAKLRRAEAARQRLEETVS